MKNKNIKVTVFIVLTISMVYYIGWVFYMSEPKYIDNCNKKMEKYDYVIIPEYEYKYSLLHNREVINGFILQVDEKKALIKCKKYSDEFYELDLKESVYRIVGKGTIYHKVNDYVGFNIMVITQLFIGILCAIIMIILITTLTEILK